MARGSLAVRAAGGLMVAAVAGAVTLGALAGDGSRAELAAAGPACPFKALTGLPCPFCGMTRATLALGDGDVVAALGFHPLAPLVLALAVWCGLQLARGRPLALFGRPVTAAAILVTVGVIWAAKLGAGAIL